MRDPGSGSLEYRRAVIVCLALGRRMIELQHLTKRYGNQVAVRDFGSKNGTFVNWLTERRNLPPGDPVPAEQMAAFQEVRDRALALLPGWQSQRDAPVAANTQ